MSCIRAGLGLILFLSTGCSSPAGQPADSKSGSARPGELDVFRYRIDDVGVRTAGFYPTEYSTGGGGPFAWSDGNSSIEISLLEPRAVQYIALDVANRGQVEQLEFKTNDGQWAAVELDKWKNRQAVPLPRAAWPKDTNRLLITLKSETWLPGGDRRNLGVAIGGVRIDATPTSRYNYGPPLRLEKRVVILAGPKRHPSQGDHPPGEHEFEKTARLLVHWLQEATRLGTLNVQTIFPTTVDKWPGDLSAVRTADTIVIINEGMAYSPFTRPEKLAFIAQQVERGCGLVLIHHATEVPATIGQKSLMSWVGGFVDPAADKPQLACQKKLIDWSAQPSHPIVRGLIPFTLRDEHLTNFRLRYDDARFTPILPLGGRPEGDLWAWAWERGARGRSFALLAGHSTAAWKNPNLRKALLNGIVWTAGTTVPMDGVDSEMPDGLLDTLKTP